MKTRLSLILVCLAGLTAAAVASDKSAQDGKARVLRVAERYNALTNYDFRAVADMQLDMPQGKQSMEARIQTAGVRPDWLYMRIDGGEGMGTQVVMTPDSTWTYIQMLDQYTVTPPVVSLEGSRIGGGLEQYFRLATRAEGSRAVRREAIAVSGTDRECDVVALPPDTMEMDELGGALAQAETLWVDAKRDLVLKHVMFVSGSTAMGEMAMTTTVRYEEPDLANRPPDSLFTFTPPPGAERIAQFQFGQQPERSKQAGGPAASFTLADLAGKQVSLAEHKGKVVLLDFWATWCGPCRIELPHVDKLNRDLADKGLVVLAITAESREQASAYLEKNKLGLRCLIDAGGKVNESYGIRAIPTVVVIDRNGNVSDFLVGLQSEKSLLAAVKKAGIE
ncbi:MAG TPA: redoxin domain-containing protein [Candidatus Krumholzibacteria bacterium]|nr:redoxin domain-containing protein [Candidatus Krumholzibacteria bacterium]